MATTLSTKVHRIEVRRKPAAGDPRADALLRDAEAIGITIGAVTTARVYLIEADLSDDQLAAVCDRLLADPVVEIARATTSASPAGGVLVEVHPLPGVMDPAAKSVADAIRDLTGVTAEVSTGHRYELLGLTAGNVAVKTLAERLLANPVVHGIHTEAFHPTELPKGHEHDMTVSEVPIRELDDAALERMSRDAHLFLDLEEMQAIRAEYQTLGREPTEIELETLAQTWSEHCVHKTLKSRITYRSEADQPDVIRWAGRPGHTVHDDGTIEIDNLLKSTVAAATHELIAEDPEGLGAWCLSVFVDNAGIVGFDDDHAVCIKVETHNHPSAIEPYGGAATGIGGCIRDIIGTGLAAKPIANTDVFCVALPEGMQTPATEVPSGCLPPKRILTEVVAGVRDYGNRMGIPTINGSVNFDDRYVGNPLVFAGCVGVMPRALIEGEPQPGDLIVALGGKTGRDGIHGATFSSAELTDTHADEFSHAVQIGNPIEEKRVLDAILKARGDGQSAMGNTPDTPSPIDHSPLPLFSAITDCGAGGFSSAVGEMGEKIGATVQLDAAPLKYAGLTPTEIWISEAQERMVLAVPQGNLAALQAICDNEHVELAVLGTFGTPDRELILNYGNTEVGRMPMAFLHDGIPTPKREAVFRSTAFGGTGLQTGDDNEPQAQTRDHEQQPTTATPSTTDALMGLLSHPDIASKHWIIRQYDHEVQGNTVLKPLVGPRGIGPGDASVIEPVPGTGRGLAIGCGLATPIGDQTLPEPGDPYLMALASIDECVRNVVCVGGDPSRLAILDNFCWPSCKKPENLASLVRAAEGCYDGAKAYRTPFVSGKDSLNNQFTIPATETTPGRTIEIPCTLLITGMAIVTDLNKCVTMDAKRPGNVLMLVGGTSAAMGGSRYQQLFGLPSIDDPAAIIAQLHDGLDNIHKRLPGAAKDQSAKLLRALTGSAKRLEAFVASVSPAAQRTVDRLRDVVGAELIDRLESQIGTERLQDFAGALVDELARRGAPTAAVPTVDLKRGPATAKAVAACIDAGLVRAAHDVSDGGALVAVAEMLIAAKSDRAQLGASLTDTCDRLAWAFSEAPSRYILEVAPTDVGRVEDTMNTHASGVSIEQIGVLDSSGQLKAGSVLASVDDLTDAWRSPLNW
ncbi:MAG: phosphoribosylformylglycinamidine synthase subunit PurS [Planctomycetota bacterium]